MLRPLIRRDRKPRNSNERGVTLALVAVAMVSIIAMAALSIDIGTLYEAKSEAQRAADAAALAAARTISISGITGDPANSSTSWQPICGGPTSLATLTALKVAQQNQIGGVTIPTGNITVTYGNGPTGGATADCSGLGPNFAVNPIVTVKVQRTNLPIFFARVFSLFGSNFAGGSVSATAAAEAFNPSNSGTVAASGTIPVNPRCVKPWIIPNIDPAHSPAGFVNPIGSISALSQGLSSVTGGAIGETFNINADCVPGAANCKLPLAPVGSMYDNPPIWNSGKLATPLVLEYIPANIQGNAGAVPTCTAAPGFQTAVVGCDQDTAYSCGINNGSSADLTENPVSPSSVGGDTSTATQCLINQSVGHDSLDTTNFPFRISAQAGSPLTRPGVGVNVGDVVTTSNSIVTLPIYDGAPLAPVNQPQLTIVGFLQVFINNVDGAGNLNVTVLNVAGCSNTATNPAVTGTSPVPVRLITPP